MSEPLLSPQDIAELRAGVAKIRPREGPAEAIYLRGGPLDGVTTH